MQTKRIVILALDGVVPFDLAVPCEIFGRAHVPGIRKPYEVIVCGESHEVRAGPFSLCLQHDFRSAAGADTLIVPGIGDIERTVSPKVLRLLQAAAQRGARIASICTGAFVLALAGLLDGKSATTHWIAAEELSRRFPKVSVDKRVLFIDNGKILTSAGAAAGLDLCLHMVRMDFGASVAAEIARLAVMPLERPGGQAQFITHEPPCSALSLAPVLAWLEKNLMRSLGLSVIARKAGVSTRTLNRRFKEQTGTSPYQWLQHARIRRARNLLETTDLTIEEIAEHSGFGTSAALREYFASALRTSPMAYRRSFAGCGR